MADGVPVTRVVRPHNLLVTQVVRRSLSNIHRFDLDSGKIVRSTILLAKRWQKMTGCLHTAGWNVDEETARYAGYCLALGITVSASARKRACHCYNVCPWCWCRHIAIPLWETLYAALVSTDTKLQDVSLLTVRASHRFLGGDLPQLPSVFDSAFVVQRREAKNPDVLWRTTEGVKAVGSWNSFTVEPSFVVDKRNNVAHTAWQVRARQALVIPKAAAACFEPRSAVRLRNGLDSVITECYPRVTQKLLIGIVSKLAAYPSGMFSLDDAIRIAAVLNYDRRRRHATTWSGVLRGELASTKITPVSTVSV